MDVGVQASPNMVRLNVSLGARSPRHAQNLLEAFQFLMMGTRFDAACTECTVWLDSDSAVRYTELWTSEEDMRRRVSSAQFTSLLSVVEAAQTAHVQFDFVTKTRGLDYVKEVRDAVEPVEKEPIE
jgi:quinol monooxygenase YgiN